MTANEALDFIKKGLAIVPTQNWNDRVGFCLAVQVLEKELLPRTPPTANQDKEPKKN